MLSYGEMIARIAELMLVHRPSLGFGVSVTPLAARLAAAIAGEDPELVLPLMEGLRGDLLAAEDDAAEMLGVELHAFDSAVEHALGEWGAIRAARRPLMGSRSFRHLQQIRFFGRPPSARCSL